MPKESQLLYDGKYRIPSARLAYYDYAKAGLYFITVNALNHRNLFGNIKDGGIELSVIGRIVDDCWKRVPEHFPHVELDYYQVMPNHFHAILILTEDGVGVMSDGSKRKAGGLQAGSVSIVVNAFKGAVTYAAKTKGYGARIWQPRFHDHIIRSEKALEEIRYYTVHNPLKWTEDRYYREGQTAL